MRALGTITAASDSRDPSEETAHDETASWGEPPRSPSAAAIAGSALAADLPETQVNVIGYFSNLAQTQQVEKPFWTQHIPEASNGKITVDYNNMDVLGVNDFSILRMTQMGVTDFAASDISKMAGDNPVFEGCDLAGITNDIDTARKACEAWRPVMAEAMQDGFNTKLMVLAPNPPIVFWCRDKIGGLDDLKGKKVRVFNKTQADFVSAVGGETVTMAFPEVVPALQRGVVDCALTGTPQRQHRRLARGLEAPVPDGRRLVDRLRRRQPGPVEQLRPRGAGVLHKAARHARGRALGRSAPRRPRRASTATSARASARWARRAA